MRISTAVEREGFVYVYDAQGSLTSVIPSGFGKQDGLKGFTGRTVSVQRDRFIYTYDAGGSQISMIFAG